MASALIVVIDLGKALYKYWLLLLLLVYGMEAKCMFYGYLPEVRNLLEITLCLILEFDKVYRGLQSVSYSSHFLSVISVTSNIIYGLADVSTLGLIISSSSSIACFYFFIYYEGLKDLQVSINFKCYCVITPAIIVIK